MLGCGVEVNSKKSKEVSSFNIDDLLSNNGESLMLDTSAFGKNDIRGIFGENKYINNFKVL